MLGLPFIGCGFGHMFIPDPITMAHQELSSDWAAWVMYPLMGLGNDSEPINQGVRGKGEWFPKHK